MASASAQSPEPSKPHGRRRLPWIVLGLAAGLVGIYGLLPEIGPIGVDRGYLAANQEHGYGYACYRIREASLLWHAVRLSAAILWKAEKPPVFPKDLTINGHYPAWPSDKSIRGQSAVYALQPDYTLMRIPLSSQEMGRLSSLLEEAKQNSRFRGSEFWRTCIEPDLRFVESTQESQPSTTSPADGTPVG
jgi:hypothetical protein